VQSYRALQLYKGGGADPTFLTKWGLEKGDDRGSTKNADQARRVLAGEFTSAERGKDSFPGAGAAPFEGRAEETRKSGGGTDNIRMLVSIPKKKRSFVVGRTKRHNIRTKNGKTSGSYQKEFEESVHYEEVRLKGRRIQILLTGNRPLGGCPSIQKESGG